MEKLQPALEGKAGARQHCALSVVGVLAKRMPSALGEERGAFLEALRESVSEHQGNAAGAQLKAQCEETARALCALGGGWTGGSRALVLEWTGLRRRM